MNHAPGPWAVHGKTVKSIHHQRAYAVARVGNELFTPEANEANARLIAAAPDLLKSLDDLLVFLSEYDRDYPESAPVFERARAAIAKATGEQA